jgi:hypothetical protein
MQFDSLELQKNIEEKRLIYGNKLYSFLLKKIELISNFFNKLLLSKNFPFYSCLTIFLISILIRSARDIGAYSSAYLEFGEKILQGGKYYQDLFISSSPLSLYLSAIPIALSKLFAIQAIFSAEIFYNIIGLIAVISLAFISRKSTLKDNRKFYNLVLFSFICSYFLRIFSLQSNEFNVPESYFLLFAYPYLAYQFPRKIALNWLQRLNISILAALIFCLKPYYFLLPLTFLINKAVRQKSFRSFLNAKNLFCLSLIIGYFIWISKAHPQYFDSLKTLAIFDNIHLSWLVYLSNCFFIFVYNILPLLILIIVSFDLIKNNKFAQILLYIFTGASLIVIFEGVNAYNQLSVFYALCLPLIITIFALIIQSRRLNLKQNWFILGSIMVAFEFDVKSFVRLAFDLLILWGAIFLLICWSWRKFFKKHEIIIEGKKLIVNIFLLKNWPLKLFFLSLSLATLILSFIPSFYQINYILCTIILTLLIFFHEKLYKNLIDKNFFSKSTAVIITIIFSYYLSIILVSIFNYQNLFAAHLKSPNKSNSQLIYLAKNYAKKPENNLVIISNQISGSYPFFSYIAKKNPLATPHLSALIDNIQSSSAYKNQSFKIIATGIFYGKNKREIKAKQYLFQQLKNTLKDKNTSLFVIYKKNYSSEYDCKIGFLEYYLQDKELREIFFKNFNFLSKVTIFKEVPKENITFISEDQNLTKQQQKELENLKNNPQNLMVDIEVYIRKYNL